MSTNYSESFFDPRAGVSTINELTDASSMGVFGSTSSGSDVNLRIKNESSTSEWRQQCMVRHLQLENNARRKMVMGNH